jgi:hypothetical protein
MAVASTHPSAAPAAGRGTVAPLSQHRQRVELRQTRERTRNTRFAAACAAAFVLLLGFGLYTGWPPLGLVTPPPTPADLRNREFEATRVGHVLLTTRDTDVCRQLQFHNDTGKFSGGQMVRCDDATTAASEPVSTDTNGRGAGVRAWFSGNR